MRKLFGTDGIRGKAREFPLDVASMVALGESLSHRLRTDSDPTPRVLLGMDTRESGLEIARALTFGLEKSGGISTFLGVVPTPAVAYLCRVTDARAAISISASHNPYEDNGVKVFGHDGMKLSDDLELQIEKEMLAIRRDERVLFDDDVDLEPDTELVQRYEDFLLSSVSPNALAGRRVALDVGFGAAYRIAPEVFRRAGADVRVINDTPDGRNINLNAGALHPERLGKVVVESGAEFGVAFDGDADRAIFVDDRGNIRNGDEIIYLWALENRRRSIPHSDTVVTTVMSNLGFERALRKESIRLLRAAVGDKYVLELMLENNAILGGEQSGHIIDLTVHSTGDGVHTALVMGEILAKSARRFSEIPTFEAVPQVLKNLKVKSKPPLDSLVGYSQLEKRLRDEMGEEGRILVRYSGTENLVRVMVEGTDAGAIDSAADRLIDALADEIGV